MGAISLVWSPSMVTQTRMNPGTGGLTSFTIIYLSSMQIPRILAVTVVFLIGHKLILENADLKLLEDGMPNQPSSSSRMEVLTWHSGMRTETSHTGQFSPLKWTLFLILILSQLTIQADSTVSWLREAQLKFQQILFFTQSGE